MFKITQGATLWRENDEIGLDFAGDGNVKIVGETCVIEDRVKTDEKR